MQGLRFGHSLYVLWFAILCPCRRHACPSPVLRGLTVGDLTVQLGDPDPKPRYMELEPLEGVKVLAERSLLELLPGATLHETGLPVARHLAISLDRPERWIEFLEHHPGRRG